ncbi:MAG: HD domain-containing protein [Chloroflexi bacterium]|nr:HD domain-containing protein [Chloroflexota bacterium]
MVTMVTARNKGKIFVVDPDIRHLTSFVVSLADEGFEVSGSHLGSDVAAKLEAGFDVVINIFDKDKQGSAGALVLCKTKSSPTPIAIVCPLAPDVFSADRVADLVRTAPEKARLRAEAAFKRQPALIAEVCQAIATDSGEDGVRQALGALARAAEAEAAHIFLAEDGRLTSKAPTVATGVGEPLQRIVDLAAEQGKLQLAATFDSVQPDVRSAMTAKGIRSALAIPLMAGNRLVAVFSATISSGEARFSDRHIEALAPLAGVTAMFLQNSKGARKAKETGEALATAMSSLEQREREVRALNGLLQGQHARMMAVEENTHIDRERYLVAARFIAASLESGRPEMRAHSEQVATWALTLAQSMNLSVEGLGEAAYLHDIGCFSVVRDFVAREGASGTKAQRETTEKAGVEAGGSQRTTAAELEIDHPVIGEALARLLKLSGDVSRAIRHHHENYDGSGFPDGLSGDKIPIASRLVRVADAYTGMMSAAAGKERLSGERALEKLRAGMRKEYDPVIVEALVKLAFKRERPSEGELISTVSHELRSPLSYLVGYSELLASTQDLPAAAQQTAKEIYIEASHMAKLVEDMLDLSRLEMGQGEMKFSDVDLAPLIERAVTKAKLRSAAHRVDRDIPPSLPHVQGNADRLMQVLDNLLDNAIKYSPDGGTLLAKAVAQDSEVLVSVSDQGIGIPKDKLEMIFEKFQRLESPLKHKVAGTGIGLSLCRHVIESHGGRIWAESEEGKGSTLFFTLPFKT